MKLKAWLDADDSRTHELLAKACGCTQPTISKIAAGAPCSDRLMKRIYKATGGEVTPNDLVLEEAA